MFKLFSILEEVDSPVNGKVQVVRTLEGVRILVGGISQSGWLVKRVWEAALKKLHKDGFLAKDILILGLGGGSAAQLVYKYFPGARLTGVDIDPIMVSLGKKYLTLGKIKNLKIFNEDAYIWVDKQKEGEFDLVLIDLYIGGEIPKKFRKERFIKSVFRLVKKGGVAVFNHLYSQKEQKDALKFGRILRQNCAAMVRVQPEANIIFLCYT